MPAPPGIDRACPASTSAAPDRYAVVTRAVAKLGTTHHPTRRNHDHHHDPPHDPATFPQPSSARRSRIAFGLSCLVLAWLLATGNLVPQLLAYGMAATGVVYLVGSFAALFAPSASAVIEPFYAICLVVELAFAIRLVTRGLDAPTRTTTHRPVTVAA